MPKLAYIPPAERIPLMQKIAFAVGQKTDWVATTLMTSVLWMPFFNIGLGINPVVLGGVLMLFRAWDAITDPVMGNFSDNARTPWGRRRPFILVGAIATAALYPAFWHIPASVLDGTSWLAKVAAHFPFPDSLGLTPGNKAMIVYLTSIGLLFFSCFTVWSMPYYALQLELTPNYDERTRLTAFMALFTKLSNMVFGWTFMIVVLVGSVAQGNLAGLDQKPAWLRSFFSWLQPWLEHVASPAAGEKPVVTGMRMMCWVIAGLILLFGVMPALVVKERYYEKEAKTQASEPFWKGVGDSIRCLPLWSLVSVSFFLVMGYSAIGSLGQYVNIYYVCDGDMLKAGGISGLKGTVLAVAGICMLPVFTWLGEKYDKRTVVLWMLATSMTGHLLNYFLMTPTMPYLQIVSAFFESTAVGAVWMFLPSMKADVADWDERRTHRRREGAVNAFYSWFIKASLTASLGIGGGVLQFSRFDPKLEHQPEHVIDRMFGLYLGLPVAIWSVAFLCVWFYPLTRARCAEIRAELEARRGRL